MVPSQKRYLFTRNGCEFNGNVYVNVQSHKYVNNHSRKWALRTGWVRDCVTCSYIGLNFKIKEKFSFSLFLFPIKMFVSTFNSLKQLLAHPKLWVWMISKHWNGFDFKHTRIMYVQPNHISCPNKMTL